MNHITYRKSLWKMKLRACIKYTCTWIWQNTLSVLQNIRMPYAFCYRNTKLNHKIMKPSVLMKARAENSHDELTTQIIMGQSQNCISAFIKLLTWICSALEIGNFSKISLLEAHCLIHSLLSTNVSSMIVSIVGEQLEAVLRASTLLLLIRNIRHSIIKPM